MEYQTSSNTLGFYKSRIKNLRNGSTNNGVVPVRTLQQTQKPGYTEVCYVDLVYDGNNQPVYKARVEKYLDNLR